MLKTQYTKRSVQLVTTRLQRSYRNNITNHMSVIRGQIRAHIELSLSLYFLTQLVWLRLLYQTIFLRGGTFRNKSEISKILKSHERLTLPRSHHNWARRIARNTTLTNLRQSPSPLLLRIRAYSDGELRKHFAVKRPMSGSFESAKSVVF